MDLPKLIRALSNPAAYPRPPQRVDLVQTHISVVFLAGEFVYKIKKPVALGFADFSSLDLRRHFCQEEVRLNARLADDVYLDLVPIVQSGDGVQVEGAGEPIEWAVKMRRLPDDATLEHRLARGEVGADEIRELGRQIAAFHATAERGERIARVGRFDVVARNARDNFEQSRLHVGQTISDQVYERLQTLTESVLARHRGLIEARAQRGVPCDTHGDLRLDHVYRLTDGHQSRTVIIDCIEFNEQFRYADPVADTAFLAMSLKSAGREDLASVLADAYLRAANDQQGAALFPFYTAYRAAVRGKVEGLKSFEAEVPAEEREAARERARGYWLLALDELEEPSRRPALVLVAGLPGSGKSTLAALVAEQAGFEVIRSDVVRKELAGESGNASSAFGSGIYTPEWNERTYAECLRRSADRLFAGGRVIVDASFREEAPRQAFLQLARRYQARARLLVCQADPATIRERLSARSGDVSDADWRIYEAAAQAWEAPRPPTQTRWHSLNSAGTREATCQQALTILRWAGVV